MKRKTDTWTDEDIKRALAEVESGCSIRQARQKFYIPYPTLREWYYGVRTSQKRGPPAILSPEEEQKLVDYILAMC